MTHKIGFDREKYIELQSKHIHARREEIGGKLYLEMGGKLFDDMHASRVLPGFTPDNKIAMLERIKEDVEILICINAKDISRQKVRADLGILYEDDLLRLVDVFRSCGFLVENIVMTQLEEGNSQAEAFIEKVNQLPIGPGGTPVFSAHQMCSAPLGADPATSVANPSGELHDTPGVWIADASAMPTCSGVNPMITVMAVARRTATNML